MIKLLEFCTIGEVRLRILGFSDLCNKRRRELYLPVTSCGGWQVTFYGNLNSLKYLVFVTFLTSFEACKTALVNLFMLSHRNHKKILCIYANASDLTWSAIVTQVLHSDLSILHTEHCHDTLRFISSPFNKTQWCWSILEKELTLYSEL